MLPTASRESSTQVAPRSTRENCRKTMASSGAGAGSAQSGEIVVSPPDVAAAVSKRANALSWDSFFMSLAQLSAMRSKDPSTQVGACIVDADNRVVSIGYNGFPRGCSDDVLPWAREAASPLDTKYPYVCHAEMNAILNKNTASVRGARLYASLFPCNDCCKLILQSGIVEVVFLSDKYHDTVPMTASRRMMDFAGVKYRQYLPPFTSLELSFVP